MVRKIVVQGLAALTLCVLSSGLTWIVIAYRQATPPRPPLAADLEGATWETQSENFNRRVRKAFPVGSSEEALVQALRQQGFKPDWGSAATPQQSASFYTGYFPCNERTWVVWTATPDEKLVEIKGYVGAICL